MVIPGFGRWALAIVVIALILALVAAATVVMASAVLQPETTPVIQVQPELVVPGEIVIVTGRGWPTLTNTVLVIALSPTRDLATAGLLPVGAVPVDMSGRFATSFVYPADVPWTAVREVWVVARTPTGNIQAAAHLGVRRLQPTATPTPDLANTPMSTRQQVQGAIVQLAPDLGLMVVSPFGGGAQRGVGIRTARIQFADGRSGTLADLRVGLNVAALGWFDSAGVLAAEQVTILEVTGPIVVTPAPPICTETPAAPVCTPTTFVPPLICTPVALPGASPATPRPHATPAVGPTALAATMALDTWQGEFWPNPWFLGPPVLVREYRVVDFNWRQGAPAPELPPTGYAVRWAGTFWFPDSRSYRFLLLLRGNARLWVDEELLIDRWDNPPPAEYQAEVALAEGPHQLRLEYQSLGSPARIQLRWEAAGIVAGVGL